MRFKISLLKLQEFISGGPGDDTITYALSQCRYLQVLWYLSCHCHYAKIDLVYNIYLPQLSQPNQHSTFKLTARFKLTCIR